MDPIRPRITPNYNGTPIDLPKLRARMREVVEFIRGAKAHYRARAQAAAGAITLTESTGTNVLVTGNIGATLHGLKAEATALCMLRAAMRGKVHMLAPSVSLRYAVAFATGVTVQSINRGVAYSEPFAREFTDLAIERMAEKYAKEPKQAASSNAA